jgi:hypothetical protein
MKIKTLLIMFACAQLLAANAQDGLSLKYLNPKHEYVAEKKGWSFYLSPPPLSGHALRVALIDEVPRYNGEIPPSFAVFHLSVQKFFNEHLALGIQYKYSSASVDNAVLFDMNSNTNKIVNFDATAFSTVLYARYYYEIVFKSRFNNNEHPKYMARVKKNAAKIVAFSGLGLGYGKVDFTTSTSGNFKYPSIASLQNMVYSVELVGINYYVNKHWGIFGSANGWNYSVNGIGHLGLFYNP